MLALKSPNWDSAGKTEFETLTQVGRDEVKARMKELESELARAEQTSALREEVFCLFPCFNRFLRMKNYWGKHQNSWPTIDVKFSCRKSPPLLCYNIKMPFSPINIKIVGLKSAEVST